MRPGKIGCARSLYPGHFLHFRTNHSFNPCSTARRTFRFARVVERSAVKSTRAKRTLVKVPPEFSSQECYLCGTLNQISLDVREFVCRGCGRLLNRDRNASRIVLKRGILQVGQDKGPNSPRPGEENPRRVVPQLKPVETGPLPPRSTEVASPVIEAGTRRGRDASPTAGSPRSPNAGRCHKASALHDCQPSK